MGSKNNKKKKQKRVVVLAVGDPVQQDRYQQRAADLWPVLQELQQVATQTPIHGPTAIKLLTHLVSGLLVGAMPPADPDTPAGQAQAWYAERRRLLGKEGEEKAYGTACCADQCEDTTGECAAAPDPEAYSRQALALLEGLGALLRSDLPRTHTINSSVAAQLARLASQFTDQELQPTHAQVAAAQGYDASED